MEMKSVNFGNFVQVNHGTKEFQKLFLINGITSVLVSGRVESFLLWNISCVFIPQTEASFYFLKEAEC